MAAAAGGAGLGGSIPFSALLAHPFRKPRCNHRPTSRPVLLNQIQQALVFLRRPRSLDDAVAPAFSPLRIKVVPVHIIIVLDVAWRGIACHTIDLRGLRLAAIVLQVEDMSV